MLQRSLILLLIALQGVGSEAAEWPQFRGPDGQGHASASDLPLEWNDAMNVVWKARVPGSGWSSPVIDGQQIWMTTATDEGRSLRAVCVEVESGTVRHDVELFRVDHPAAIHKKNSHASPTPVLENDRVYVHFGDNGTACLDRQGNILWRTNELKYQHGHGPAGSPVVYGDLLIVSCDGTDTQYLAALDKHNGALRWKQTRQGRMAYSTPLVIRVAGRDQLVSTGGDAVAAYVPETGEEIWRVAYDGYSEVPRPVYGHGLVFVGTGYDTPWLYAIRPDGQGDVTETHVAWKIQKGAPLNPSPVLVGDELYFVSDNGIASCVDAETGKPHWRERLPGNYSSSPLAAAGRVYFTNETGLTTVVAAGRTFQVLAENQVSGQTLASLAVAGRAILLRTNAQLYRIEQTRD